MYLILASSIPILINTSTQSLPPVESLEIELMLSKATILATCHEFFLRVFLFLILQALGLPPFGCFVAAVPLSAVLWFVGHYVF